MRRHRRPPHRARRRLWLWPRLRRHPVAYWTAVALAVAAVVGVSTSVAGGPARSRTLGPLVSTPVARHTIDAGELVEPDDVEWRDLPAGAVASEPLADAFDRRAAATIYAGEPVVADRLAPEGASALASRVPAGHQAVALPITVGAPPLEAGDVVDLLGVGATDPTGGVAQLIARRAVVIDAGDEVVTVAVDDDDVRSVATAAASGAIVISLDGPR